MEKQLSYVVMLSLEEIALRKIALYNERYILTSIAKSQFKPNIDYSNIWAEPEEFHSGISKKRKWRTHVKHKMSKLQLPKSLTKQMIQILKAVGSEIYKWKLIHEAYLSTLNEDFNVLVLAKLYWTTAGTVDYRKTAEELVHCDVVDIVTRFELACLYCLENYILMLWKELPEEKKRIFCKSQVETPHLQLFLPYILEREKSKVDNLHRTFIASNYFEYSALYGDKTLAEYCFWKLAKEDREASLVRTAKYVIKCRNEEDFPFKFEVRKEKLSDVLCYLLSLMPPEEQIRIFKELPCEVLRCFLDWPWQDLFLDIADVIWTFLPESEYNELVYNTIFLSYYKSGYYFPNIFQNFFLRSPIHFRKFFVDKACQMEILFWTFFINEDTETIKVIFRNIDAVDRVRLVSSEWGLKLIYHQIHKWHLVEVFLREAMLSKEDKERLKEAFMELLKRYGEIKGAREVHRRFFEFVEETIH